MLKTSTFLIFVVELVAMSEKAYRCIYIHQGRSVSEFFVVSEGGRATSWIIRNIGQAHALRP